MLNLDTLDFAKGNGTVTVVAQDAVTGQVLMVAHADREALEQTISTGEMHYRSRTRGLWHKGATSGNTQQVVSLTRDCDGDAVLARVISAGPACHVGSRTCFEDAPAGSLGALAATIEVRWEALSSQTGMEAEVSYTQRLFKDQNLRLKKLGEEIAEVIVACTERNEQRGAEEGADVLYHLLVALRDSGVVLRDVEHVLARRSGR